MRNLDSIGTIAEPKKKLVECTGIRSHDRMPPRLLHEIDLREKVVAMPQHLVDLPRYSIFRKGHRSATPFITTASAVSSVTTPHVLLRRAELASRSRRPPRRMGYHLGEAADFMFDPNLSNRTSSC